MSSTGCKHSSVIDMNGHQEIRASLAFKKNQLLNSCQVRLNRFEFSLELCIHELYEIHHRLQHAVICSMSCRCDDP